MFGVTSRAMLRTMAVGCCALDLLVAGAGRAATRPPDSVRPSTRLTASPQVPPLGDAAVRPEVRDLSVLVVGDSWGTILSIGMEKMANLSADRHNLVIKAARAGCGIMQPTRILILFRGQLITNPGCNDWPEYWRGLVARFHPQAVLLESGIFDTHNPQQLPGQDHATTITDPVFRAQFDTQIDRAIRVLGAGGARVFLTTLSDLPKPYWNLVNGSWSVAMNAALHAAAERNPAVRLLDMHGQMCTDDRDCPAVISGIPVYDETTHPTPVARDRLAAWILNSIYADLHAHASRQ
ncbi:SGNH hydrolase domain-containing protein [Actinoallomurus sp. NPDC050550]|uniref:SGNH hydrolase domain-containing protein n=1 Tax=Actinoallomurus sp. NPDC050550 TaxID=3154937 RepID=UPI0033D63EE2